MILITHLFQSRLIAKAVALVLLGAGLSSSASAQSDKSIYVYNLSPAHERVKVVIDGMTWMGPYRFGEQGVGVSVDLKGRSGIPVEIRDILTDELLAAETIDIRWWTTNVIFYGRYRLLSHYTMGSDEFTIVNTDTVSHYVRAITSFGDTIVRTIGPESVMLQIPIVGTSLYGPFVSVQIDASHWYRNETRSMIIRRTDDGVRPYFQLPRSIVPFDSGSVTIPGPRVRFVNVSRSSVALDHDTAFPGTSGTLPPMTVSPTAMVARGRYYADVTVDDTILYDDFGLETFQGETITLVLHDDPFKPRGYDYERIRTPHAPPLMIEAVGRNEKFSLSAYAMPAIADTIGLEFYRLGEQLPLQQGVRLAPDESTSLTTAGGSFVADITGRDGTLRRRVQFDLASGQMYALFIGQDRFNELSVSLLNLLDTSTAGPLRSVDTIPVSSVGGFVQIVNLSRRVSTVTTAIDQFTPQELRDVGSDVASALYGEIGPDLSIEMRDQDGAFLFDSLAHIVGKEKLVLLLYDGPGGGTGVLGVRQPHALPIDLFRDHGRVINLEEQRTPIDVVITTRDTTFRFDDNAFGVLSAAVRYEPVEATITLEESASGRRLLSAPWVPADHVARTFVIRGAINDGSLELVEYRTIDGDTARPVGQVSGISSRSDHPVTGTATITPNPAATMIVIDLELAAPLSGLLTIYDVEGERTLAHRLDRLVAGRHAIPLDVSELPAGVYVVGVEGEGGERIDVGRVMIAR